MPILGSSASQNTKSFLNPNAPTIGTATNAGSGRAYNNGSATVAFTAAASGAAATSFTATSSPGGYTVTGASSPLTVTGLQSATAYTFVVKATNAVGDSSNSSASNSITATTVPQAPTIGSASQTGNFTASVTYTAGANGGSAVSGFAVSPASGSGASPISISGLSRNTSYSFTITATNSNGSATSGSSNSITTTNTYSIGEAGPGGGIVFYDAGSVLAWGRYLEAATADLSPSTMAWSGNEDNRVYTSAAIGTGSANTTAAIAQNNTAGKAITAARAYTGGGKSDWFLPSKDELNALYGQRGMFSGFSSTYYWSSTEYSANTAELQSFFTGDQAYAGKWYTWPARAVRAF